MKSENQQFFCHVVVVVVVLFKNSKGIKKISLSNEKRHIIVIVIFWKLKTEMNGKEQKHKK